jgi:5-methylcytosine-specific restriction endonuclease McrA
MIKFAPKQPATIAHNAIKSSLKTRDTAHQYAVLWFEEILTRKLYRELGYSSINQYAKLELGFSKSHTGEFLALCKTFKKLPRVKQQVASGKLTYTSARVIAPVMDEENQDQWLASAENKSRRQLVQDVKRAKQEARDSSVGQASLLPLSAKTLPAAVVPVRVNMEMSPTQFARYEKLWEQMQKTGSVPGDKVEAMLEIMESYVAAGTPQRSARADLSSPTRPPVQIHIHQCPDCKKATVQTGKGELEISMAQLERAQCDCQTGAPNQRNTTAIPPATRRNVLASARHKCQRQGCDHTRFLELHHIIPRRLGGTNKKANLQVLCSACHQIYHEAKIVGPGFQVEEPTVEYGWASGVRSYSTFLPGSQI